MLKFVSAVAAAAAIAAIIIAIPGFMPEVAASTTVEAGTQQPLAKADRLPLRPLGASCSAKAWPYYNQDCLLDPAAPAGKPRTVRIISVDRTAAR